MYEAKPPGARYVAVFPGAFRPPHVNHYITVADLAARSDVKEVVVIVANRARAIPDTPMALGVDVALRIWAIYLRNQACVRIEVADGSAVSHALGYVDRCRAGEGILLCIGKDAGRAHGKRVQETMTRAMKRGVCARAIAGSPNVVDVHATALRACLASGERGRARFDAALPAHLDFNEREAVWRACISGMVEHRGLVRGRLPGYFAEHALGRIVAITVLRPRAFDEVFRVELDGGERVVVKCAHDTVSAARAGEFAGPKPRKRLKVECAALQYAARVAVGKVDVPRVVRFDKRSWTLVLSEVCDGSSSLQELFRCGRFDIQLSRRAAAFLGGIHSLDVGIKPLRDDAHEDRAHWHEMLDRLTRVSASRALLHGHQTNIQALRPASEAASMACLVHLDYCANNILVCADSVGVVDFENASSYGDPAFDLGLLVSDHIQWGLRNERTKQCIDAVVAAVDSYRMAAPRQWALCGPRLMAFAGAFLLLGAQDNDDQRSLHNREKIERLAIRFLNAPPHSCASLVERLCNAIAAQE